jgi:hypothetical protein
MIMRVLTTFTVFAGLVLASPTYAQSQSPQPQPNQSQAPDARPSERFTEVEIIDMKDLPPDVQTQVNNVVAKMQAEELSALRNTIDTIPQATSALKAKGLSSSQVVAISLDDRGTLTLITKLG